MLDKVRSQIDIWIKELEFLYLNELYASLPSGKQVRAMLVSEIAGTNSEALKLSAIIEMIHFASLLHDDVIDEATTRRGKASVNATEGSKVSVMVGDILYAQAFSKLSLFKQHEIAKVVASSVAKLSVGELMDVKMAEEFNADKESYMKMVYNKTASLIESACKSAAILAGKDSKIYAQYGKNLGLAFQIVDDVLDITADEKELGKPVMSDFIEGKTTLPYIYLYERLGEKDRQKLISLHGIKLDNTQQEWLISVMKATKALERSLNDAKKLSTQAYELMIKENEKRLADIALNLVERRV